MKDLLKEIYCMLEEDQHPALLNDLEYKRCDEEADRLWDAIAADLGKGGNARLNELMNAQAQADDFWRYALFRRTLALGVTLGRLEV